MYDDNLTETPKVTKFSKEALQTQERYLAERDRALAEFEESDETAPSVLDTSRY